MSIPTRYRLRGTVEPPIPDAPGYDTKPHPSWVTTSLDLGVALEELRQWAGSPSFRTLSARCEGHLPAHATFHAATKGLTLPRLDVVLVFVAALGLAEDLELWANAWRRVAALQRAAAGRRLTSCPPVDDGDLPQVTEPGW